MARDKAVVAMAEDGIGQRIYEDSLIIELLRLRGAMRLFFRPVLSRHRLTDQNWRIIKPLAEVGPIDMTRLSQAAVIPMASLSRMVTRMEAGGLVQRVQDEGDRRQVLVKLTPKGRRLHAQVAPQVRQTYAELSVLLTTELLEQLHTVVLRLNTELSELIPADGADVLKDD
jgi:homoprotocatechuate degradation regulator HpaR